MTPRQTEVARCLTRGLSNKAIARELGIACGTVKIHVSGVIAATKARNRTEAAVIVASMA